MKKVVFLIGIMICLVGCDSKEVVGNTVDNNQAKENTTINSLNNVSENIEENSENGGDITITKEGNKENVLELKDNDIESNKIKEEKAEKVEKIEIEEEIKVQEQEIAYENGVEVGNKAIDFGVELLSGEKVKLSNFLGKPIFLNFWATWCGPCVGEMPDIEKIKTEYGDKLEVILINGGEAKEDVKTFIDRKGYTFNVALDKNGEILTRYDSMYIPLSIFIDENGIIVERKVGALSYENMKKIVENLVK